MCPLTANNSMQMRESSAESFGKRAAASVAGCTHLAWHAMRPNVTLAAVGSPRHLLLRLVIIAATLWAYTGDVAAQDYPTRPVRLYAGQSPGGQTDIIARTVAQKLSEMWGQPVIVRNHTGAAGTIAADVVATSPADGYTMLLGSQSNLVIAAAINPNLSYQPMRDFIPIARVAYVRYALVTSVSLPLATTEQLVAYARAHPGRLTYASTGYSALSGLAFEMLKHAAGLDILGIQYKDSATALKDVVAGRVDMMIHDLAVVLPHIRAGTLHAVALLGATRSPTAPDIPTFAEQGYRELEVEQWYGVVVPRGVPHHVVTVIDASLADALHSPEVRARFEQLGYDPIDESEERFADALRSETRTFTTLIERLGIKPGL
jgi:tripartite-type tricarboxylate transporter receptor subunit TctC